MARWTWIFAAVAGALGCNGSAATDPARGGATQDATCQGSAAACIDEGVRWWEPLYGPGDQKVEGVGTDAAGTIHLLLTTADAPDGGRLLELRRFDPAGTPLGTSSWAFGSSPLDPPTSFRMAVAPDGDIVVALAPSPTCSGTACGTPIDLGAGPVTSPALARLGPAGELRWQRPLLAAAASVAVDAAGAVTVVAGGTSTLPSSAVQRLDAGGNELWTRWYDRASCANDEEGDVVCQTASGAVEKLAAADGATVWSRWVGGGQTGAIAAHAGRIALVVQSALTSVIVLDGDGVEQWEAPVDCASSLGAAIGPSGRVFVAGWSRVATCGAESSDSMSVTGFASDGTSLWTRALQHADACQQYGDGTSWSTFVELGGMSVTPGGEVALAVDYSGALDVAGTTLRSDGFDAVLAVLRE